MRRRTFVSRLNDLHLNRPRLPWTWLADGYAALLAVLSVTGALLAVRKGSLARRGVLLTLTGLLLAAASLAFTF